MSADQPEISSAEAMAFHYDVGTDFYRLWLDPTLTYSAAMWGGADITAAEGGAALQSAQLRKLRYALSESGGDRAQRLLDVGCGWGSLLQLGVQSGAEHAFGLTLSQAQVDHIRQLGDARIGVAHASFRDHTPSERYGALCCIGGIEHFARRGQSEADRIALYREFFSWCHTVLAPGSRMYVQCIAYGDSEREQYLPFFENEVFPESDMPRLWELCRALDRLFEITCVRNDRADYVRTVNAWLRNLRHRRAQAVALTSEATVARYCKYLGLSAIALHLGTTVLYRISLRRLGRE